MSVLLTTPPLSVFEHMALDETLVHTGTCGGVLRFYNWADSPAVTFGYAQFVREVRRELEQHAFTGAFCRRPTGGGVVYHREDLTFSLIFSSQNSPTSIYKQLHQTIQTALVADGIQAHVFSQKLPAAAYAPSQHNLANCCFINPVENDLLLTDGQKMLGGAIRRFGTTVLYQGSVQFPRARFHPACKKAIIQAVRCFLQTDLQISAVDKKILSLARQLADSQYNTPGWMEKF